VSQEQPQQGYQQPGYQQQAYQQPGYQQPGYQQPGYQQPAYRQPGYPQPIQNSGAAQPIIHVMFAGKGSRLLQWVTTTHQAAGENYYRRLFEEGYRGQRKAFPPYHSLEVHFPKLDKAADIKYEVSKGLAKNNTDLCNPEDDTPSEIVGETGFNLAANDGYTYTLDFVNTITPEMMENIGKRFYPSREYPSKKFSEFCNIFYKSAQDLFDMDISKEVFKNGLNQMNIVQYIQTLPEFINASRDKERNNGHFDFVAPIVILEGMKFYDDYLLKSLK
ncbi:MAG: hypothetical protein K2K58_00175, partial [Muribaculaceae bacterium]|nr:hypothetical protein [Muribaculaceae bacterium]